MPWGFASVYQGAGSCRAPLLAAAVRWRPESATAGAECAQSLHLRRAKLGSLLRAQSLHLRRAKLGSLLPPPRHGFEPQQATDVCNMYARCMHGVLQKFLCSFLCEPSLISVLWPWGCFPRGNHTGPGAKNPNPARINFQKNMQGLDSREGGVQTWGFIELLH